MNTPILLQNNAGSITIYLELTSGGAATGILPASLTADIKKEGQSSFSSFSLSGTNFTEIGNGFYEVDLAATDTDVLGNLYLRFSGPTIKYLVVSGFVAATAPVNPSTITPPSVTDLYGFIYNPDGTPVEGATVSVKVLTPPQVLSSADPEGFGITTPTISTKTDAEGFFTLKVVSGLTVDVLIPSIQYRRVLIVPATNSNVFDIP